MISSGGGGAIYLCIGIVMYIGIKAVPYTYIELQPYYHTFIIIDMIKKCYGYLVLYILLVDYFHNSYR